MFLRRSLVKNLFFDPKTGSSFVQLHRKERDPEYELGLGVVSSAFS